MGIAKIHFADGETLEADTWEGLEEKLRTTQFQKFDTKEEFREEMARRALVWSEEEIEINGDSLDFFWELSRAQLLEVVIYAGSPKPEPVISGWVKDG